MKKGLFSILASALLVVGCQNYDDQFDDINITANNANTLASQAVEDAFQAQALVNTFNDDINTFQVQINSVNNAK